MKTYQIKITKENKKHYIKFNSELPMESALAAVKAVVKNTYNVSIKEIHWKVPGDRNIEWAIKEASNVRFYHKAWKETIHKVPVNKLVYTMKMPKGTKVDYNCTTNTFFDIKFPYKNISLNLSEINRISDLSIYTTNNGIHPFYLIGCYDIKCIEDTTFTEVAFYKICTRVEIKGEYITEEL